MKHILFFSLLLHLQAQAQLSALEILQKSIKVHDPKNRWEKLNTAFEMSIVREKVADRYFIIHLNLPQKSFAYEVKNDSLHYKQGFVGSKHEAFLNERTELSEAEIKKYDLSQARTQYLREVYEYLMLLPMRLQNDVKFLSDKVQEEVFNQKACYKITVQYEPADKNETWHFFIDKQTFVLHGYQFYLKDKTTNGEYIYLEDYQTIERILMPKTKRWYWNKDGSFFRTDRILGVK
jgi:Family of unknown function (DUF6503)